MEVAPDVPDRVLGDPDELGQVLINFQMPEMDGIEAAREIRKREAEEGGKRTCIIGLTAHACREIKEECLTSGMDQVLTKPVKINDLFSAIDAGLSD
jgi:CheY-like chemotaxis protein